jgi:glycosyltransferase involved in cell wall biosynthesis
MRVTHVITRLVIGGAQENTVASVLGLRSKPDLEARLLSGTSTGPEGSLVSSFQDQPGLLQFVPSLVRPVNPIRDLAALLDLTRIFRATRPQIVHTHSGKAGVLGRLAAARAGVPVIIHTIHGPSFGPFQGAVPNLIFKRAERIAGKVTTHFVTVADAMTRQYLAAGIGRPEQFTRIFSGFSLGPFLSAQNDVGWRRRWQIGPDGFVIGKISRLFKLKGHDDLLTVAPAILQRCPQVKFLIVGDGAWRGRLQERARSMGLENHFIFTGLVPPEEVPRYLGMMDILVHLSRREGLARALPQALAAGKPVIAYDCDGAAEVCRNNETGFLVRPGDLSTLVDRVVQLAADASLRHRLGEHGREFVRENFSVETMVERLHRLYLQLT